MAEIRKRSNAEIDALNQFLKEGEKPLPYELTENNEPIATVKKEEEKAEDTIELTEEEKKIVAEKEEADRIAAEKQRELEIDAEIAKRNVIAEDKKIQEPAKIETPAEIELDDEKVLAYFRNKKGKELTSLEELLNPKKELTEEEKKQLAEKRDADKFAFGLSKGIFSKKQLEEFITDTKNPQELVYSRYYQEQKEKDPDLSDSEIKEEFEDKFSLNEGEDSRKFKVGQNLLNNIADSIISKKHSKILNLENDYSSYEIAQAKQKESETKILSQAPLYKKDVEQIRSEIKNVSIPISDTENFETELPDGIVDNIISKMLDKEYSIQQISNGWNKESIKQVAKTTAIIESLPQILKKYADEQVLKNQAGVRGVVPTKERGVRQQQGELTERQKQALNFAFGEEQTVAN